MIDKTKLAELRKVHCMPETAWQMNDLIDTIEAVLAVVRAAEALDKCVYDMDWECAHSKELSKALAEFRGTGEK